LAELEEHQVTLHDYLQVLYRGRWIITLAFVVTAVAALIFSFLVSPIYEAKTTIMIEQDGGMQQSLFGVSGLMERETEINNQVEILKSRTLAEEVLNWLRKTEEVEQFSLIRDLSQGATEDDAVQVLRDNLTIVPLRETDIIEIKYRAPSPREAAHIANAYANQYYQRDLELSRGEISEVRQFLKEQLVNIQDALELSEEQLRQFKEQEKVAALSEETEALVKQLAEFEGMYNEAATSRDASQKRLDYLRGELAKTRSTMVDDITQISSPLIQELRQEISNLEAIRAGFIAKGYDENFDKMVEIQSQIEKTKTKMKEEASKLVSRDLAPENPLVYSQDLVDRILSLQIEVSSLNAKAQALNDVVREYEAKLQSLPEKSLQLARLERAAKVNENIYLMMREKYEEARITEAGQMGMVRVIDRAKEPLYPIRPKKKLNLILGAIIGLGLGIGITLLVDYLDDSLKSIEDIERYTGLRVLGSIPEIKTDEKKKVHRKRSAAHQEQEVQKIASRMVTHFEPKSPVSEAYRTFRTNIQFARFEKPPRTLLVTSAGPGEGKSTSVANLAITMAQMGTRTLLVDADLRRPVLHSIFEQRKDLGLTNVLLGNMSLEEAIHELQVPNLSLLCCGTLPPNPSELLGSEAMRILIERLKETYDVILFDSPPVVAVTDAAVLSTQIDGTILIVSSGETTRNAENRAKTLLNNVQAQILGAVLNNVRVEGRYGSYYYYYYYHYYGPRGSEKKRKKRRRSSHR
jgi:polysaccharide chain length determinant protein (PEP-CTERM system associated)